MSCWETHDAHELGSFGPSHVETKHATGFSVSFWLHPLRPLPKDGTRGADAVWEVKLEGRGGWRAHHKIINLDSFCRFKIIPTGINYLCVKTKHACKYSAAHLTGQEFPSINQRSKRRERIKVRHFFAGQASRTSEKNNAKISMLVLFSIHTLTWQHT